jgi:hypothetical protein
MKGYCTMTSIGNYGRFANMLFQVAGVIGVARKNGLQPVFRPLVNLDHKERFGSNEDIDVFKYFKNPLPAMPDGIQWRDKPVDWGYNDVRLGPGNWNLSGHFQSFKYFAHCFDEVKWYMRMKDERPLKDCVALHSRRGDYDNAYHPVLGLDYYAKAIEAFPKDAKFILFSDDVEGAMQMLSGYKDRIIPTDYGMDYIESFKLMKACRHFIIGNSSFSAMAAILGEAKDKRVIAPAPWFGPKYTKITGKDIYCDDWTVIDYEQQNVTA